MTREVGRAGAGAVGRERVDQPAQVGDQADAADELARRRVDPAVAGARVPEAARGGGAAAAAARSDRVVVVRRRRPGSAAASTSRSNRTRLAMRSSIPAGRCRGAVFAVARRRAAAATPPLRRRRRHAPPPPLHDRLDGQQHHADQQRRVGDVEDRPRVLVRRASARSRSPRRRGRDRSGCRAHRPRSARARPGLQPLLGRACARAITTSAISAQRRDSRIAQAAATPRERRERDAGVDRELPVPVALDHRLRHAGAAMREQVGGTAQPGGLHRQRVRPRLAALIERRDVARGSRRTITRATLARHAAARPPPRRPAIPLASRGPSTRPGWPWPSPAAPA